ncbi:hypothetical protein KA977_07530, partial [Candidatus Dependentiae bacterium]|nr:hypothetical protein [Candidatus Dependentiae bacterium]
IQKKITLLISIIITILWTTKFIIKSKLNSRRLWIYSAITTIAFLISIGYIWYLSINYTHYTGAEYKPITDKKALQSEISNYIENSLIIQNILLINKILAANLAKRY